VPRFCQRGNLDDGRKVSLQMGDVLPYSLASASAWVLAAGTRVREGDVSEKVFM